MRHLISTLVILITAGLLSISVNAAEPDSPLWTGSDSFPSLKQIETLPNIEYVQVKERMPEQDGYKWQHGAAIVRYKGDYYVSVGVNTGSENTVGEKILMLKSPGDWKHWQKPVILEPNEKEYGRSHGVFLEHEGRLWAFHAKFAAKGKKPGSAFPGLTMEAFQLNDATGEWENRGDVAQGIWPLHEPKLLPNGVMAVAGCDENWHGSFAFAPTTDLLHWTTVKVNAPGKVYTEANFWQEKNDLVLLLRNESQGQSKTNCAAVARSQDWGRTWSVPKASNLAMNTSKPACGTLSNGMRYLVGLTASNNKNRSALTIAVSRPGENGLCHIWKIRDVKEKTPQGAFDAHSFSYPHAVEYDKKLFVIYSVGDAKRPGPNWNHVELAVIPLSDLRIP